MTTIAIQTTNYQIEQGDAGFIVRILERHWSGAESYTLPQIHGHLSAAIKYAEGWLGL